MKLCHSLSYVFSLAIIYWLLSIGTVQVYADSPFSIAYATLTNGRFSMIGRLGSATVPIGGVSITVSTNTSDNSISDVNTDNLFPNDTVCFNNQTSNGCAGQLTYTVSNIQSPSAGTTFSLSSGLSNNLVGGDRIIASQSGRIAITFRPTTTANVANLRIYIPAASSTSDDGIPDRGKFDANTIDNDSASSNIVTAGGSLSIGSTYSYSLVTIGGQYYHNIMVNVSSLSTSSDNSLIIGHASNTNQRFINPAPSDTNHVRGVSDTQVITAQTEDSSGNIINKADMGVNPNDGVYVSAYVPTSVSWTIGGIGIGITPCYHSTDYQTDVSTTATGVPFGTIYSTSTFFDAAHSHTITTNAAGGYFLQVYEDGVLTRSGGTETIPNTTCGTSTCTTTQAYPWTEAGYYGFGYTVAGVDSVAGFANGTNFKPFATSIDVSDSTSTLIASRTSTVSNGVTYVCYRLNVSGTQAAGLYQNRLTYVAGPRF
jgi:hypothetical protein